MALVLPLGHKIGTTYQVLGSATFVKTIGKKHIFATCNHIIGTLRGKPLLMMPKHGGNISKIQDYPFLSKTLPLRDCEVLFIDSFNDLTFIITKDEDAPGSQDTPKEPVIIERYDEVNLGDKLSVFAYPLSISESFLMTSDVCFISAKARRLLTENYGVTEYVINYYSVKGASGGGVFRHSDNKLVGILRGNLAKTILGNTEINSLTSFVIPASLITENLKQI